MAAIADASAPYAVAASSARLVQCIPLVPALQLDTEGTPGAGAEMADAGVKGDSCWGAGACWKTTGCCC
jgi:hypothetical protein